MPAALPAGLKLNPHSLLSHFPLILSHSLQTQAQALPMGCEPSSSSRRPFCLTCSKPARLCLCSRFTSPPLPNNVPITILQHALEKHHPVNSTRVAKLGLKNLTVAPVTDINFHSTFLIRPNINTILPTNFGNDSEAIVAAGTSNLDSCDRLTNDDDDVLVKVMDKYKVTYSSDFVNVFFERNAKPCIKWLMDTAIGRRVVSDGFWVRKVQRREVRVTKEFEDFEEFDVWVPPGSALLFPSDEAVGLKEVGFEVKHLVVLDGTWSKAKRMYHENPWLQLLPHVKLELGKESLYSGVRTQPKEGYLSTIESIVFALDALGEDKEGLDELLDVFDSMIMDQKQCKAEKFKTMSLK